MMFKVRKTQDGRMTNNSDEVLEEEGGSRVRLGGPQCGGRESRCVRCVRR